MRRIAFVGDSYMRHTFQAFLLVLSTDYEYGTMDASGRSKPECAGEGQFEEKQCRMHLPHTAEMCGGAVSLNLTYTAWPRLTDVYANFDVVFYSAGNHALASDGSRYGLLNASAVQREIFVPLCVTQRPAWLTNPGTRPKVYWLTLHARLLARFNDEAQALIQKYNFEISQIVDKLCGFPIIDFFTFTDTLIRQLPGEAENMTWDGMHWSRSVNLIKAQALLRTIS